MSGNSTRREISVLVILIAVLIGMTSCGTDYSPIESTDDELRIVAFAGGYAVRYDEYRYAVIANRKLIEQNYSADLSDTADGSYREQLLGAVEQGIKHNIAVCLLLKECGYNIGVFDGTEDDTVKALIDECGGRDGYVAYLEENALTDRLVRYNINLASAENELMYIFNDLNMLDKYLPFDFTDLDNMDAKTYYDVLEFIYSSDIYIKFEYILCDGEVEDRDAAVTEAMSRLTSGADMQTVAESGKFKYLSSSYVAGECSEAFFDGVLAIEEGKLGTFEIDGNIYLVRRLSMMQDVNENYYDIVMKYARIKTLEMIDARAGEVELDYTEFGNGLDVMKIQ